MIPGLRGSVYAQDARYKDSLLQAAIKVASDSDKARVMLQLAAIYNADTVAKKFYYASEALRLSEQAHWDKGIMAAERIIGDCYNGVQAYSDALVHLQRAANISEQLKRTDVKAVCWQLMVHSYHMLNDMPKVLEYQSKIIKLVSGKNDAANECAQQSAYAIFLAESGRNREAIDIFNNNIVFANKHFDGEKRMKTVGDILNSMSLTYVNLRQTDSALQCLRASAALARQSGDSALIAYINSSFCDVFLAAQRKDSAIVYAERTVEESTTLKIMDLQQRYYEVLSKLYDASGDPHRALHNYRLSDSLLGIISNTQKAVNEATAVAKITMDQQADRDKLEKRSLEVIRRNQRTALIAAALALIAFVVLTIIIYRNLRQKQKANKTITQQAASLQQQNELIDKALHEKEVLLKETHHRVKNNLQLISSLLELQAANIEDENAKDALRAAQRRVLSIATVHSKLYGSDDEDMIEFSAFSEDLFLRLSSAFSREGRAVSFSNAIPTTRLPLNIVVLLGLILNELVTNSFKHAFISGSSASVAVSLKQTGNTYILSYHDNGPGLPEGKFEADAGSLGLYLVRRLSKQLKGAASYKFEAGSTFMINFPYAGS